MQSLLDTNLERIKSEIQQNSWNNKDIVSLMNFFRHILESSKSQGKYKYINLYSNWVFHTEITKNSVAMDILDILTDSMIKHNVNPKDGKWVNDAIIEGLSLHLLREEILSFSKEFNLGTDVNIYEFNNWKNFAVSLIKELLNKPLKVIQNKTIYNNLIDKANKSGYIGNAVLAIYFWVDNNGIVHWKIDTPESLRKGVSVIGPMSIISQQMIDGC
ncbi:MAG: hypothetical protein M1127_00520 [Patescibacteria group bacterium]|nr:hypothetical protein [Patescibacteria group bacterium]